VEICTFSSNPMWITYSINVTHPVIPTAFVACAGEGFLWAKTCDFSFEWYIAPYAIAGPPTCNQPAPFSYVTGCN
jgi:hypothetical protein